MRKTLATLLLLLLTLGTACGGRVPSDVKTAKLTRKYFNKYAKKYKDTAFSGTKVAKVEVKRTQELQKNLSTSFVLLNLDNGQEIPIILTILRKAPKGWRINGWEWVRK